MTATFVVRGQSIRNAGKLTFENGGMQLTDRNGVVTRLRRHAGPIPGQYDW